MKIANKNASEYVNSRKQFQGSNMFGKWLDTGNGRTESHMLYAVFSYGSHFPMYIYDPKESKWLGNTDKYSQSTTRQQQHSRPSHVDIWYNTEQMKEVVYHGSLVDAVMQRART